jgi:WD40 repeat protein
LAAGSWDQSAYLLDATAGYQLLYVLKGNSSSISHVDFSADGRILLTKSKDTQSLYYETATGARITRSATMRDTDFTPWGCVLGWPTRGIWDPDYSQDDVNAVCQSHGGGHMVLGDDYGMMKLLRYPCLNEHVAGCAGCARYWGHSSHVTNVSFSADDARCISTGGMDAMVIQWKFCDGQPPLDKNILQPSDPDQRVATNAGQAERKIGRSLKKMGKKPASVMSAELTAKYKKSASAEAQPPRRVQLGRAIASVYAPTGQAPPKKKDYAIPGDSLELLWAHGYQGRNGRNNVALDAAGQIVYYTAGVGVVLNSAEHRQQHYLGHNEDMTCFAMHPDKCLIATGQRDPKGSETPCVKVWDSRDMSTQVTLSNHARLVCAVAFSADGNLLLSIGGDDDHTMNVWNWRQAKGLLASGGQATPAFRVTTGKEPIHGAKFALDGTIVTFGEKVVKFWMPNEDGTMMGIPGKFGRDNPPRAILSVLSMATIPGGVSDSPQGGGLCAVGGDNGNVYIFVQKTGELQREAIPAHGEGS